MFSARARRIRIRMRPLERMSVKPAKPEPVALDSCPPQARTSRALTRVASSPEAARVFLFPGSLRVGAGR